MAEIILDVDWIPLSARLLEDFNMPLSDDRADPCHQILRSSLLPKAEQKPVARNSVEGTIDVHGKDLGILSMLPGFFHVAHKGRGKVYGGVPRDCAVLVGPQQLVL